MKYRLYIDEVGNPDLGASENPNHRYLSLTGVILELGYVDASVFPHLEDLKRRHFGSHADDPVILHRKEIVNRKPPFEALANPEQEKAFNKELLAFLDELEFVTATGRDQVLRCLRAHLQCCPTAASAGSCGRHLQGPIKTFVSPRAK